MVGVGPAVAIGLLRLVAARTQDLGVLHADDGFQPAIGQLQVEAALFIAADHDGRALFLRGEWRWGHQIEGDDHHYQ